MDPYLRDCINKSFNVNENSIVNINNSYTKSIAPCIDNNFLAHFKSYLEKYARDIKQIPFIIELECTNHQMGVCEITIKETHALIEYDGNLNLLETRMGIAHELSHLYYDLIGEETNENNTSILAIFIMHYKDEFYKGIRNNKKLMFKSKEDLVSVMSALHNKLSDKYTNLSGK